MKNGKKDLGHIVRYNGITRSNGPLYKLLMVYYKL